MSVCCFKWTPRSASLKTKKITSGKHTVIITGCKILFHFFVILFLDVNIDVNTNLYLNITTSLLSFYTFSPDFSILQHLVRMQPESIVFSHVVGSPESSFSPPKHWEGAQTVRDICVANAQKWNQKIICLSFSWVGYFLWRRSPCFVVFCHGEKSPSQSVKLPQCRNTIESCVFKFCLP